MAEERLILEFVFNVLVVSLVELSISFKHLLFAGFSIDIIDVSMKSVCAAINTIYGIVSRVVGLFDFFFKFRLTKFEVECFS